MPVPAPIETRQPHPRGMVTLFFTEMWERMSYYGMRALLVLFMVDAVQKGGLGLDDKTAVAIYGLYTAAVYLAALPGGWVGDRLLGLRGGVWWGGVIIFCGHVVLGFHGTGTFYAGLILVALGSGLLKSNMSGLVGQLYPEGGARRDAGFTLFYMGVNLGAFIGPLACSWLGETFGWRWGFSAAAVGMLFGLIQFRLSHRLLGNAGVLEPPPGQNRGRDWTMLWAGLAVLIGVATLAITGVLKLNPQRLAEMSVYVIVGVAAVYFVLAFTVFGLTTEEKKRVAVIAILFLMAALFWAGFEQVGSSLTLFADRFTLREFGTFEIPAGWFQSINPLIIILFAPVIAALWVRLARAGIVPRLASKFAWGLLLLAFGFLIAAWAADFALPAGRVWPTWLISVYFVHTIGELFLSPVGLSAVTKLSPPRLVGQMMGVWFLAASLGNVLAGLFAGVVSGDDTMDMPVRFLQLAAVAGGVGILLWALAKPIQKLMPGIR